MIRMEIITHTCQTQSAASQVHDCVVYRLDALLGSVGHRVKIHKITPATGNRLPPPRTLILDFTMILGLGRSNGACGEKKTKETCVSIGGRDPFLWLDALSMPTPQLLVIVYLTNLPAGICLSIYLSIGSCSLYTQT